MREPQGLIAGGRCWRLPPGAQAMAAQMLRPAPLARPGLLGITVLGDLGVPVLAAAPGLAGGPAWVRLAEGVLVAGEAYAETAPDDAAWLSPTLPAARPVPPATPPAAGEGWAVPARAERARIAGLAAELGALRLVLPSAAMERVIDLPALRPAPGAAPLAQGFAVAEGEAVLVLDPAALVGTPEPATPSLLALFRHAGRRFGLPCTRIGPAEPGEATLVARLDALLAELPEAPLAQPRLAPQPEPMRGLLLAQVGELAFALPVEEVMAAIPPIAPTPVPGHGAGIVAHRGDVLPVRDGGLALGQAAVLAPGQSLPLLRLNLPFPVALAVSAVTGLRQIPTRLLSATGGEGALVAAIAALPDGPLPVLRAGLLAGLP